MKRYNLAGIGGDYFGAEVERGAVKILNVAAKNLISTSTTHNTSSAARTKPR